MPHVAELPRSGYDVRSTGAQSRCSPLGSRPVLGITADPHTVDARDYSSVDRIGGPTRLAASEADIEEDPGRERGAQSQAGTPVSVRNARSDGNAETP